MGQRAFAVLATVSLLTLLTLWNPTDADAHTKSLSYSSWKIVGSEASVRVRLPRLELTRLRPLGLDTTLGPEVSAYLAGSLRLRSAAGPCTATSTPEPLPAAEGWSAHGWRLGCPSSDGLVLESEVLRAVAPSHLHFARVQLGDAPARERVLFSGDPSWPLATASGEAEESQGTTIGGYLVLGVEHILTGWDHLAFLMALLLLARRLGEVVTLVTGFTVAHSVTLALAVLGWVHPEPAAVEAVIAFSVALVAAENGWLLAGRDRRVPAALLAGLAVLGAFALAGRSALSLATLIGLAGFSACHFALLRRAERPERLRAALAFAFGLVHGFGFAGVLAELSLPTARLAPALFGFNVGVELGQLGVVALVWPALLGLDRLARGSRRRVAAVGSAAICGLGCFWLVVRALGSGP